MEIYWLVIDYYDGMPEIIGVFPTRQEAQRAKAQFIEDTDGECTVRVGKYRKETKNGKDTYYAI